VSIDEIARLAKIAARSPYSALLLFGSFARGDQDDSSDIDIVQVTPTRTKSYSSGRVNITCYTTDQLCEMARSGSLFVKHLVLEAIPLVDPGNFLETLRRQYIEPTAYDTVVDSVICSLPVVAISADEFQKYSHTYAITAGYLLRTYIYASAFAAGANSFSMKELSARLADPRARAYLRDLRVTEDYPHFRRVVDLLFELTHEKPFLRTDSLEALIVNLSGSCKLAVILGLRLLAEGELIEYDVLQMPVV
jgi:hypothetical protein